MPVWHCRGGGGVCLIALILVHQSVICVGRAVGMSVILRHDKSRHHPACGDDDPVQEEQAATDQPDTPGEPDIPDTPSEGNDILVA